MSADADDERVRRVAARGEAPPLRADDPTLLQGGDPGLLAAGDVTWVPSALPGVAPGGASPGPGADAGPGGGGRPRFVPVRELGAGGMGRVVEWWDHDLCRPVAAKLLHEADPSARARFLGEAQTTAQLAHPNVVPVHDLGVTRRGEPYYTMQRVQGRSLAAVVGGLEARDPAMLARWPLVERVSVLRAVAQALAYAHARGVVHQDLKPDNVMVGGFGEVLVLDWGLAWARPGSDVVQAQAPALGGTPRWMAPEQVDGQPPAPASDVYALGGLLYALLTGGAPFRQREEALLKAVLLDPPEPPSRRALDLPVPRELEAICLRALAKEPADRYADASAFLADLDRYRAGLSVSARRDPPWTAARRWTRRHPAVSAGALVGALVAGGVAGAFAARDARVAAEAVAAREAAEARRVAEVDATIDDVVARARAVARRLPHEQAVTRLLLLRHPRAAARLEALLRDPEEWVRLLAVDGLGWTAIQLGGEPAARGARALAGRLADEQRSVRRAALRWVARLGAADPDVVDAVVAAVTGAGLDDPAVRATVDDWRPYLERVRPAVGAAAGAEALRAAAEEGLARGRLAEARAAADELRALRPGDPAAALLQSEVARARGAVEGDPRALEAALARAGEAAALGHPPGPVARLRADALLALGRFDEAASAAREAAAAAPDDPGGDRALGRALHALGRLDEAASALARAVELARERVRPDDLAALGIVSQQAGRREDALRALDRALELDPEHVPALRARSFLRLEAGARDAAVLDQERALQLAPRDHHAHENRGGFFYALFARAAQGGRLDEAAADLARAAADWRQALALDAACGHCERNLGAARAEQARLDERANRVEAAEAALREALARYERAGRLGPVTPGPTRGGEAGGGVGHVYFDGRVYRAPAGEDDPADPFRREVERSRLEALGRLGVLLARAGRLDEAAAELTRAVEGWVAAGAPSRAAHQNRAITRHRQGDGAGALADFERALELAEAAEERDTTELRRTIANLRRELGRE